jgi:hypothetical protein
MPAEGGLARLQLPIFFLMAYAITWSAQIPAFVLADARGHSLSNDKNIRHVVDLVNGSLDSGLTPLLLLVMFSFGPTIAGIVVTALFKGRAGLSDLFARTVKVRIGTRWILVALLLPVLLSAGSVGLAGVVGDARPSGYSPLVPLSLVPLVLVYMLVCTAVAEEVGWRGYALPELQRTRSAERASWILGIGWGLWHLPSNLLPPYLTGELTPGVALSLLLALTVGIVGWTIVLTWFFNNTGSVFWVIVIHGWLNTLQLYLVLSSGSYAANVFYVLLPWALAVYLLKRFAPVTLRGEKSLGPAGPAA